MASYREHVWPAYWILWALVLVIPASMLVFAPLSWGLGATVGIALYLACVGLWLLSAPVVEVRSGVLRAGRARIPLADIADPTIFEGPDAFRERGQNLDPSAWMLIRGGVADVVTVPVVDPDDPTPYWIISTRHAKELAAAITTSRRP